MDIVVSCTIATTNNGKRIGAWVLAECSRCGPVGVYECSEKEAARQHFNEVHPETVTIL